MKVQGMFLSWIVVANIAESVKFYTTTMGLTLHSFNEKFGWAELSGPEGARLGLAQQNLDYNMKAGTNAVITITVDDIDKAKKELLAKGVQVLGEVLEIPGEVKLQTVLDSDGNMFQLAEMLRKV